MSEFSILERDSLPYMGISNDEALFLNGIFNKFIRGMSVSFWKEKSHTELVEICSTLEERNVLPTGMCNYLSVEMEERYLALNDTNPALYQRIEDQISLIAKISKPRYAIFLDTLKDISVKDNRMAVNQHIPSLDETRSNSRDHLHVKINSLIDSLNKLIKIKAFESDITEILTTLRAVNRDQASFNAAVAKSKKYYVFIQADQKIMQLYGAENDSFWYGNYIACSIKKLSPEEILELPKKLLQEAEDLKISIEMLCKNKIIANFHNDIHEASSTVPESAIEIEIYRQTGLTLQGFANWVNSYAGQYPNGRLRGITTRQLNLNNRYCVMNHPHYWILMGILKPIDPASAYNTRYALGDRVLAELEYKTATLERRAELIAAAKPKVVEVSPEMMKPPVTKNLANDRLIEVFQRYNNQMTMADLVNEGYHDAQYIYTAVRQGKLTAVSGIGLTYDFCLGPKLVALIELRAKNSDKTSDIPSAFKTYTIIREGNGMRFIRPKSSIEQYTENKNFLNRHLRALRESAGNIIPSGEKLTVYHADQMHLVPNLKASLSILDRITYCQFLIFQAILAHPEALVFVEGLGNIMVVNDLIPEEVAFIKQHFPVGQKLEELKWAQLTTKQKFCFAKFQAEKVALALNVRPCLYPTIDPVVNVVIMDFFQDSLKREEKRLMAKIEEKYIAQVRSKKVEFLSEDCMLVNMALSPSNRPITIEKDCVVLLNDDIIIANQTEPKKIEVTAHNRADIERLKERFTQPCQQVDSETLQLIAKVSGRVLLDREIVQKIKGKAHDTVITTLNDFILELRERSVSRCMYEHMSQQKKPGLVSFGTGHRLNFRWANVIVLGTASDELYQQMVAARMNVNRQEYINEESVIQGKEEASIAAEPLAPSSTAHSYLKMYFHYNNGQISREDLLAEINELESEAKSAKLRELVFQYLRGELRPGIEDGPAVKNLRQNLESMGELDAFIKAQSPNKVWSTDLELTLLADLFQVNLKVLYKQSPGQSTFLNADVSADKPTVTISNDNNVHWSAIVNDHEIATAADGNCGYHAFALSLENPSTTSILEAEQHTYTPRADELEMIDSDAQFALSLALEDLPGAVEDNNLKSTNEKPFFAALFGQEPRSSNLDHLVHDELITPKADSQGPFFAALLGREPLPANPDQTANIKKEASEKSAFIQEESKTQSDYVQDASSKPTTSSCPPAVAQSFNTHLPTMSYLYRGDSRSPDQIFEEGFIARGSNTDLFSHVNLSDHAERESAYIATSTSKKVASTFPGGLEMHSFVYEINAQEEVIVINEDLSSDMKTKMSPKASEHYRAEKEIAVPYKIKPQDIKGAWPVELTKVNGKYRYVIQETFIINPSYMAFESTKAPSNKSMAESVSGRTISSRNFTDHSDKSHMDSGTKPTHKDIAHVHDAVAMIMIRMKNNPTDPEIHNVVSTAMERLGVEHLVDEFATSSFTGDADNATQRHHDNILFISKTAEGIRIQCDEPKHLFIKNKIPANTFVTRMVQSMLEFNQFPLGDVLPVPRWQQNHVYLDDLVINEKPSSTSSSFKMDWAPAPQSKTALISSKPISGEIASKPSAIPSEHIPKVKNLLVPVGPRMDHSDVHIPDREYRNTLRVETATEIASRQRVKSMIVSSRPRVDHASNQQSSSTVTSDKTTFSNKKEFAKHYAPLQNRYNEITELLKTFQPGSPEYNNLYAEQIKLNEKMRSTTKEFKIGSEDGRPRIDTSKKEISGTKQAGLEGIGAVYALHLGGKAGEALADHLDIQNETIKEVMGSTGSAAMALPMGGPAAVGVAAFGALYVISNYMKRNPADTSEGLYWQGIAQSFVDAGGVLLSPFAGICAMMDDAFLGGIQLADITDRGLISPERALKLIQQKESNPGGFLQIVSNAFQNTTQPITDAVKHSIVQLGESLMKLQSAAADIGIPIAAGEFSYTGAIPIHENQSSPSVIAVDPMETQGEHISENRSFGRRAENIEVSDNPKLVCKQDRSKHHFVTPNYISVDSLSKQKDGVFLYIITEKEQLKIASEKGLTEDFSVSHTDLARGRTITSAGRITIQDGEIVHIDNHAPDYKLLHSSTALSLQETTSRIFHKSGFSNIQSKFVDREMVTEQSLLTRADVPTSYQAVSYGNLMLSSFPSFFGSTNKPSLRQEDSMKSLSKSNFVNQVDYSARKVAFNQTLSKSSELKPVSSASTLPGYGLNKTSTQSALSLFNVSRTASGQTASLNGATTVGQSENSDRGGRLQIEITGNGMARSGIKWSTGETEWNPYL